VSVSLNEADCLVINAPEVCAESLVTNDIAELSLDGRRFRILGRRDNFICSGGLKIQAEELERKLSPYMRVPYLISSRPDDKFGEIVVLLTEGDVDEARQVCESVLPKYHQPRAYVQVARIPLTETGKPARKQAKLLV
jgi:O-succinylbenzoic acid--CoA ligase